ALFGKTSTGELVNRLSADTQLVGRNLSQNVSGGLRSLIMVSAGTGMMVSKSKVLQVAWFGETSTGELVNRLSADTQLVGRNLSQNVSGGLRSLIMVSAGTGVMTGLAGNTIIILVLYYGGGMVATEQLTVGNLTSFLLYAAYVGISIGGLSSFYTELNKGIGAATRLWDIIDREPTIPVIDRPNGEIILENIHYSYNDQPLIKGLSLHLHPGKSIALVGRSGCGKSTIASLILRLYDPERGRILLDGVDIRELDPVWLRSHVGYMFTNTIASLILRLYDPERGRILLDGVDIRELDPVWLRRHVGFVSQSTIASLILRLYDPERGRILLDGVDIRELDPVWLRRHVGFVSQSTIASLILRLYDPERGRILLDGVDIRELDPVWLRRHVGFVSQSTIASLILRLYDPERGRILLDGVDIRELDPVWLRSHVGYVSQDEPDWLKAARTAHLHELVVATHDGWDRQVGARGGQLNAYSEYLVDKALKEISKDRTVLTIAHRLSTIQSADEVAVLENGIVIEKGPYPELMAKQD
ncbi:ATP-binding cassette sub-family B member 10, mitochondrial, partial [Operophtera brumata]